MLQLFKTRPNCEDRGERELEKILTGLKTGERNDIAIRLEQAFRSDRQFRLRFRKSKLFSFLE